MRTRRVTTHISIAILVAVGATALSGCTRPGDDASPRDGSGLTGREIFRTECGVCHTLEEAGALGTVGPNLDTLHPTPEQVLRQVERGGGAMPKQLVTGVDAERVAEYVAEATGGSGAGAK